MRPQQTAAVRRSLRGGHALRIICAVFAGCFGLKSHALEHLQAESMCVQFSYLVCMQSLQGTYTPHSFIPL